MLKITRNIPGVFVSCPILPVAQFVCLLRVPQESGPRPHSVVKAPNSPIESCFAADFGSWIRATAMFINVYPFKGDQWCSFFRLWFCIEAACRYMHAVLSRCEDLSERGGRLNWFRCIQAVSVRKQTAGWCWWKKCYTNAAVLSTVHCDFVRDGCKVVVFSLLYRLKSLTSWKKTSLMTRGIFLRLTCSYRSWGLVQKR